MSWSLISSVCQCSELVQILHPKSGNKKKVQDWYKICGRVFEFSLFILDFFLPFCNELSVAQEVVMQEDPGLGLANAKKIHLKIV